MLRLPCSLIKYWLHKKSAYVRTLLTNHQQLLQIPYTNTESGQCSFSYCSPKIWNEIPATIQVSATAATFKHQLKSHFLSQLATHWHNPSLATALASDLSFPWQPDRPDDLLMTKLVKKHLTFTVRLYGVRAQTVVTDLRQEGSASLTTVDEL